LLTLCPAVWTLNQGGRLVYEETALYACLVSLGIWMAVVRVACFGLRRDLLICAGLAALSGLVRPTHAVYGVAGMAVCSAIWLALRKGWGTVAVGNAVCMAGLLALAGTNWVRFGSPMEFGHRLSVTGDIIVFMSRIDNPMKEAGIGEAAMELCGWLFGVQGNRREAREGPVPWQTPHARWREPYVTTFDPGWALACAAAYGGFWFWLRRKRDRGWQARDFAQRPGGALVAGTFAWSGIASVTLAVFYLRFPNMSSRYLLDFAPAFAGFALVAWLWIPRRWQPLGVAALAVWMGYGILAGQYAVPPMPLQKRSGIPTALPPKPGCNLDALGAGYDLARHPPTVTGIFGNGWGWKETDGIASSIVTLAVRRPEFVEVLVGLRNPGLGDPTREDVYRAVIDGRPLPLREVAPEGDLLRVRFDVPEPIRRRGGDELLFLSFTRGFDEADAESRRELRSVRWRDEEG
jgi:hypothetical protein